MLLELHLPDFDLHGVPVTVCSWHAQTGQQVIEGDALIEVLAGDVTVELPAPTSGLLVQQCVEIDQPLKAGQALAVIEPDAKRQ